jgi:hypothetical protein
MNKKKSIVQIIIFAVLMGCSPVSVTQVDADEGYTSAQCEECHEEMADDHALSVHGGVECLSCHPQAVEEDHEQVAAVDCRQCHPPHDEKVTHDAHSRVACMACHVKSGVPTTERESENVIFSGMFRPGSASPPHQAIGPEIDTQCENCHFQGNTLGASSMILPAKSILCMPCHVATFSVRDKTTLVSLFILLVGLLGLGTVWFSGSMHGGSHRSGKQPEVRTRSGHRGLSSWKYFRLLKAFFLEVVILQRLFRLSPSRWIIHALIFYPFFLRFAYGLTALLLSLFLPGGAVTSAMLNKNNAMRALFFDVTGVMILVGAAAAIVRQKRDRDEKIASLPAPGRGMPAMIGFIVFVGFILEGLRIAMTGWPDGAAWAFLGYGISQMVKGMTGLTDLYGYVWYTHAILTGAFLGLIPFTRMSHIIIAPIVLMVTTRLEEQDL